MNVGNIIEPNVKGQIVIPKKMRDNLGITPNTPLQIIQRGDGIYIYPVEIAAIYETESVLLEILNKTRGSWASDNWDETRNKRRTIELKAAKRRKLQW